MKKIKSALIKLSAGTALALAGIVSVNTVKPAANVQAATQVVTVKYVPGYGIAVWDNFQNGHVTGKTLKHGSSWKVFGTTTDSNGNVWYNLGGNQWIMAKYTVNGYSLPAAAAQSASSAETAAKNWIAMRESSGSYTARNGQYYGKYQLSLSYLGGNLSPANQERVANNYVKGRYGSWVNAKNFWLRHGWY